jgi:hypothetical protein
MAMTDGLPNGEFVSFEDAVQFLACGQTLSQRPTWLLEEAIALAPLIEQCQREVQAATDAERSYPFGPADLGGPPASIIATLDQHRLFWTRSCSALFAAATAAAVAGDRKDRLRRGAHQRLMEGFQAGDYPLYGLDARGGRFEQIDRGVGTFYSDVEAGEIRIRGNDMFVHLAGAPDFRPRLIYRAICVEGQALLELAERSGPDTDAEGAPPSGEGIVLPAPGEASPSLPEHAIHSTPRPNADREEVPPDAKAPARRQQPAQDIARKAIAVLWPTGGPVGFDEEVRRQIDAWCKAQTPPIKNSPSIKTIRRATGRR